MSNRFHNKFHRANHHSKITSNNNSSLDASLDPIASYSEPFQGEFYTDGEIVTNSFVTAVGEIVTSSYLSAGSDIYGKNGYFENNLTVNENLSVVGDLTVLGNSTKIDALIYSTSAVQIDNSGSGPALLVFQTGDEAIANFVDDTTSALYIDGRTLTPGYIGINTTSPNERLTVSGNISANGDIFVNSAFGSLGNSILWNSTHNTVNTLSAGWNSTYGTVSSLSAGWNSTYGTVSSLSAGWNSTYGTVSSLSAGWSFAYNTAVGLTPLSGNWQSTYRTVSALSANWDSVYNTVKSTSATFATINYTRTNFLPSSGGSISGNLTVYGDVSSTGNQYFGNTYFTTTSALSVSNFGSGTALWVGNNGIGDIASFYDTDSNVEVLHIGGNNGTFPNVGVKTSQPNKTLTVNGEISSNNIIWSPNGNSIQWDSTYTSVTQASGKWDSTFSTFSGMSADLVSVLKRFDVVGNTTYTGIAKYPATETDMAWKITRMVFTSVGTLSTTDTVLNGAWSNRYTYLPF